MRGGDRAPVPTAAACLVVALIAGAAPATVARADCSVSGYALGDAAGATRTRESALLEAGELAANGRWTDARAVYLWVLARQEDDPEALLGLARVDAWGGCWAISETEFRRALALNPTDADVRAGYVDLLVWRGRSDEAQHVLAQGVGEGASAGAPASPPLLARQAQFAYWRGDAGTAVRLADEAERAAPDDGDVRAMRDRMFRGEARLTTRLDAYTDGTRVLTVGGQVLERVGFFELSGGAQLIARSTDGAPPTNDARYPIDVAYHPALGVTLGAEVIPGAPANAIPDFAGKVWAMFPVFGPFDGAFAYNIWHFDIGGADEIVHIFNPSVGMALPKEVRLDARAWVTYATFQGQTRVEPAVGAQVTWTPTSRVSAGLTYTYGAEADAQLLPAGATVNEFLQFRSHVVGAFGDWLIDRKVGVRPVLGLERREDPAQPGSPVVWIASAEGGVYARW